MAHVLKWLGALKKAPLLKAPTGDGECGKFGYLVELLRQIDFSEFNMFTSSLYANLHAK